MEGVLHMHARAEHYASGNSQGAEKLVNQSSLASGVTSLALPLRVRQIASHRHTFCLHGDRFGL